MHCGRMHNRGLPLLNIPLYPQQRRRRLDLPPQPGRAHSTSTSLCFGRTSLLFRHKTTILSFRRRPTFRERTCCIRVPRASHIPPYGHTLLSSPAPASRFVPIYCRTHSLARFWGTASVGSAMVTGQLALMFGPVDEVLGYDCRVVFAYIGFATIGLAVLISPSGPLIIFAFASTGLLNTFSESPLYDLAALWGGDGLLVGAMNLGAGSAGLLNITIDVII